MNNINNKMEELEESIDEINKKMSAKLDAKEDKRLLNDLIEFSNTSVLPENNSIDTYLNTDKNSYIKKFILSELKIIRMKAGWFTLIFIEDDGKIIIRKIRKTNTGIKKFGILTIPNNHYDFLISNIEALHKKYLELNLTLN